MGLRTPVQNESQCAAAFLDSHLSLVDILGTGAWRGLSRVPVSGSFSGADMISGIKDRLIWRYYDITMSREALFSSPQ